jgi:hypothetical protein
MELCSIYIGLGKQKKVGRQNKVVCKKGGQGIWFIIMHCALCFQSASEDARQPGSSLESWWNMTMVVAEAWSKQLLVTPLFDHKFIEEF